MSEFKVGAPQPAIVFLDLDGVIRLLCNSSVRTGTSDLLHCSGQPRAYFDPQCVARLNCLLAAVNAQVAIISTLRNVHEWSAIVLALADAGLDPRFLHADANVPWLGLRGAEIRRWLAAHPDTKAWCVIDDEMRHYDGWSEQRKKHVFVPCSRFGLQASTANAAVEFLAQKPNEPTHP